VTSTIAFEGAGEVAEYVGGYADWLRQRSTSRTSNAIGVADGGKKLPTQSAGAVEASVADQMSTVVRRKLTYNEQRELRGLPARIEALEAEPRTCMHLPPPSSPLMCPPHSPVPSAFLPSHRDQKVSWPLLWVCSQLYLRMCSQL